MTYYTLKDVYRNLQNMNKKLTLKVILVDKGITPEELNVGYG